MQYQLQPLAGKPPQLSLFEGLVAQQPAPFGPARCADPVPNEGGLSEMSLTGDKVQCRQLLAPVLRDLSEAADIRWLTLIAPPAALSLNWLRESGLNRDRILLLQGRGIHDTLDLACKALMSGCSHTVITWFDRLDRPAQLKLRKAASQGNTQSLNIRMRK